MQYSIVALLKNNETPDEPEPEEEPIFIPEEQVPLAPAIGGLQGSWALWNLILSIAGAIVAIMLGVRVLLKKKRERDDSTEAEEEDEKTKRSRLPLMIAVPVTAVAAIIIFLLTQNVRLPMVMVDNWTIAHAALFVGGLASYIYAYGKNKKDEEDGSDNNDDNLVSKAV